MQILSLTAKSLVQVAVGARGSSHGVSSDHPVRCPCSAQKALDLNLPSVKVLKIYSPE